MTEYNLPQAMSSPRIPLRLRESLIALLFFFVLPAAAHAAERWDAQVSSFAKKIAAVSGPGTATLELRNLSSLSAEQVAEIRAPLELQLRAAGVQLRPEHEASVSIRVTLSENRRGWLWIAEIQQGTEIRVTMLEIAEERAAGAAASAPPMTLHSSLLLSSSDVLLDVQPLQGPRGLLAALTTRSVVLYQQQNGRWQPIRELPISLQVTSPQIIVPRDPRGRIVPAADHPFDIYFPGGNCAAAGDQAEKLWLNCIASDDPWPLGGQNAVYNPARNYFTGLMTPGIGRAMPPFYSAAPISHASYTLWVFAGVNGRVSSFDGTNERQLGGAARVWGSDIAALHSGCGAGTQLLASGSGNAADSDSLQAFEIADREALVASALIKFDGSITALWSVPGASTATAIVHTGRETGEGGYDAYSISLACAQ